MTLNISEKTYRERLGTNSKCFRTQTSVIRKIEILKNFSDKCYFTEKSEFSRSFWLIKMTLKNSDKKLGGVLVPVHNFPVPRIFYCITFNFSLHPNDRGLVG